jgi:hypothetical protein
LNEVEKFKSGSHVLPRWQMRLTKDNGQNRKIENNSIINNQRDLITESWCSQCEKTFAVLDGIGANFFRDKYAFIRDYKTVQDGIPVEFESHDNSNFEDVKRFIESVIVRYYLHHLTQNLRLENAEFFERALNSYHEKRPVYVLIFNIVPLKTCTMEPLAEGNCVLFVINGYLIQVYETLEALGPELLACQGDEIFIPKITDPRHSFIQNLADTVGRVKLKKN